MVLNQLKTNNNYYKSENKANKDEKQKLLKGLISPVSYVDFRETGQMLVKTVDRLYK